MGSSLGYLQHGEALQGLRSARQARDLVRKIHTLAMDPGAQERGAALHKLDAVLARIEETFGVLERRSIERELGIAGAVRPNAQPPAEDGFVLWGRGDAQRPEESFVLWRLGTAERPNDSFQPWSSGRTGTMDNVFQRWS